MSKTTTSFGSASTLSLWYDISELLDTMGDQGKKVQGDVRARLEKLRTEGRTRWRKRITGDSDTRVRDHARARVAGLRGKAEQATRKALTKAELATRKALTKAERATRKALTGSADTRVRDHLKTTPVVKFIDRAAFTLGVTHFAFTEFLIIKAPSLYWLWFILSAVLFLGHRVYSYTTKRWGFFMLDFCYFVNAMCMINVVLLPESHVAWQTNFIFANGPLMCATLAWRNSLVFHSVDKMTSIFIHVLPAFLTFLVRWYPDARGTMCFGGSSREAWTLAMTHSEAESLSARMWGWTDPCPSLNLRAAVLVAIGVYLFWQLLQVFITEILLAGLLAQDRTLETSIRWLCRDHRNFMHQLCKNVCRKTHIFGPTETFDSETWKSKFIFWIAQFVYTILTLLPALVAYHCYTLHVMFICYVMFMIIWNGASFYIDVFSTRYNLQFKDAEDSGIAQAASELDPDLPVPLKMAAATPRKRD